MKKLLSLGVIFLFLASTFLGSIPHATHDELKASDLKTKDTFGVLKLESGWSGVQCYYDDVRVFAEGRVPIFVPDDYSTIQAAIDNANAGDIIIVRDGIYYENVIVSKRLTLKSENGPANCIIDGRGRSVITLRADGIIIKGFTVRNGGGIVVYSDNNTITGNKILNNKDGIWLYSSNNNTITKNKISNNDCCGILLWKSSNGNTITENNISSNYYGIHVNLKSNNNTITKNKISSNHYYGIFILDSSNNTITGNDLSNNKCGGISLQGSSNNNITDNTLTNDVFSGIIIQGYKQDWITHKIENNTINGKPIYYFKNRVGGKVPEDAGQVILANCTGMRIENLNIEKTIIGIQLGYSSQNIIIGNNVSKNSIGITLWESSNNTITENNISNNNGGIGLARSSNNMIYLNNFINTNNVFSGDSTNIWSSEKITYVFKGSIHENCLGNYWGDYAGSDADGDGIGDISYIINSDKDNYPLIKPLKNYQIGPTSIIKHQLLKLAKERKDVYDALYKALDPVEVTKEIQEAYEKVYLDMWKDFLESGLKIADISVIFEIFDLMIDAISNLEEGGNLWALYTRLENPRFITLRNHLNQMSKLIDAEIGCVKKNDFRSLKDIYDKQSKKIVEISIRLEHDIKPYVDGLIEEWIEDIPAVVKTYPLPPPMEVGEMRQIKHEISTDPDTVFILTINVKNDQFPYGGASFKVEVFDGFGRLLTSHQNVIEGERITIETDELFMLQQYTESFRFVTVKITCTAPLKIFGFLPFFTKNPNIEVTILTRPARHISHPTKDEVYCYNNLVAIIRTIEKLIELEKAYMNYIKSEYSSIFTVAPTPTLILPSKVLLLDRFERKEPAPWWPIIGCVLYKGKVWCGNHPHDFKITGKISIENEELCVVADKYWYNVWAIRYFDTADANFEASLKFKIMPDDEGGSTNIGFSVGFIDPPIKDPVGYIGEEEFFRLKNSIHVGLGYSGYYDQWTINFNGTLHKRIPAEPIVKGEWIEVKIRKLNDRYEFYANNGLIYTCEGPSFPKINYISVSGGVGVHWEGGVHVHFDDVKILS